MTALIHFIDSIFTNSNMMFFWKTVLSHDLYFGLYLYDFIIYKQILDSKYINVFKKLKQFQFQQVKKNCPNHDLSRSSFWKMTKLFLFYVIYFICLLKDYVFNLFKSCI